MLTTRINTNDTIINNLLLSEDHTSDRDFYFKKLLNTNLKNSINPIINTEVYEFKPERLNNLNFNLFFLRYLQTNDIGLIMPYMESEFSEQIIKTKINFGLLNADGTIPNKSYNNIFDIRQDNLLRAPVLTNDLDKTNLEILNSSELPVFDPLGQSNLKRPLKPGLPIFYNSFTFPFWDNNVSWINNPLLYKNKPYFYNSLLLMEIYDSPSSIIQKRLISIPIFINQRYNINEKNISYDFSYERPSFNLTDGCDGFSLFFINNYSTNELYVKFSFWDALNNRKITLIPSSKTETVKKWFQKSDSFKQEYMYLKYVLNYSKKTYSIFEYNINKNVYDLNRNNFDLYELAFDPYFEDIIVPNIVPIDVHRPALPIVPNNPFRFDINNIIKDFYYSTNTNKINTNAFKLGVSISNKDTYLGATAFMMNKYLSHIDEVTSKNLTFYCFNDTTFTLPVYNQDIVGFNNNIIDFNLINNDNFQWLVSNVDFENIVVGIGDVLLEGKTTYNSEYNNEVRLSEALTIVNPNSELSASGVYGLTKKLFYLNDIFKKFVNLTWFGLNFNRKANPNRVIVLFNYFNPIIEHLEYVQPVDASIDDIRSALINLFEQAKQNDLEKYNKVIADIENILEINNPVKQEIVNYMHNHFSADNYPDYLDECKLLCAETQTGLTFDDLKVIKTINLDIIKSKMGLVSNIRDYVFDLILTTNGNPLVNSNESLNFNLKYNIGKKIKHAFIYTKKITVKGKIKISINNGKLEKNIFIPINLTLNIE